MNLAFQTVCMPPCTTKFVKARASSRKSANRNRSDKTEKLTKEEKAVLKYLYSNVENKKASMYGNNKLYFSGAKAVSCLMESKFATGDATNSLFNNRKMTIEFCQNLLNKNCFHHVFKLVKKQKSRVSKDAAKEDNDAKHSKSKKGEAGEGEDAMGAGDTTKSGKDESGELRKRKGKKVSKDVEDSVKEEKEAASTVDEAKGKPADGEPADEQKKKKVKGKVLLELNPVIY